MHILYGKQEIPLRIPKDNLGFEIRPREAHSSLVVEEEIRRALAHPIGSPQLAQLLGPDQRVAVIVDDNTRLTPAKSILPHLLEEINRSGVKDEQIELIVASGTHRPMTSSEKEAKFGREILSRVRVLDHDCLDERKLLDYGTTDYGTHILANADVMRADFRIAVGSIFPHFPAGWGGGAKMLLPGIAGQKTVAQFHLLGALHSDTQLGQVDTVTRREMEAFASRVGLEFIFNVVLDKDGNLLRAFAGHFVEAHRAGIHFSRTVYEVEVEAPADLTLSSTSPIDHDYFQVMKGLYSAEVCTKPGGEILLVSPVYEGMGQTHREALEVTPLSMEEALARIRSGAFQDEVAAAIATYQIKLRDLFSLSVLSEHLAPEEARLLGMDLYPQSDALQAIIDRRLAENPGLKIGLMHHSAEVLPRVATPD
jgi:lactate racemase